MKKKRQLFWKVPLLIFLYSVSMPFVAPQLNKAYAYANFSGKFILKAPDGSHHDLTGIQMGYIRNREYGHLPKDLKVNCELGYDDGEDGEDGEEYNCRAGSSCKGSVEYVPVFPRNFNSPDMEEPTYAYFHGGSTFTETFPWFPFDANSPRGSETAYWEATVTESSGGALNWDYLRRGNYLPYRRHKYRDGAPQFFADPEKESNVALVGRQCDSGVACVLKVETYTQYGEQCMICAGWEGEDLNHIIFVRNADLKFPYKDEKGHYEGSDWKGTPFPGWSDIYNESNKAVWYGATRDGSPSAGRPPKMPDNVSEIVYKQAGDNVWHGSATWVLNETEPILPKCDRGEQNSPIPQTIAAGDEVRLWGWGDDTDDMARVELFYTPQGSAASPVAINVIGDNEPVGTTYVDTWFRVSRDNTSDGRATRHDVYDAGHTNAMAFDYMWATPATMVPGTYDIVAKWYDTMGETGESCEKAVTLTILEPSARCTGKAISTGETAIDPGQEVTFTINWENGPVPGTIIIRDEIPSGFENDSDNVTVSTDSCVISGGIVRCKLDNVEANASGNITITTSARSNVRDLETENTAYVSIDIDLDDEEDTTPDACTTGTAVSEANAVCESKSGPATALPGDILTYQIDYTVERGPATVHITDTAPEYTSINTTADGCGLTPGCTVSGDTMTCVISNAEVGTYVNAVTFCVQVDETGIPLDGATVTNDEVKVWEESGGEPTEYATNCSTSTTVTHTPPFCIITNPSVLTIRQQDVATTSIELTTTGDLGTHANLEFRWTATDGTLSSTEWHTASGTPNDPTVGEVTDTVTWSPPAGAVDTDTYDIKAYVRPLGSTDETGISANECEATSTITALDLICLYLTPNDPVGPFPFDMTFEADIGGDEGAAFTYDLDFGDDSTHYTGNDVVAAGTTIELPYIPPQDSPHTYDSTTPVSFSPSLTVTNTETGETSVCPTVLSGTTQSEWSIVKDSDVDTCVVANSVVAYSIVVTNTGDYSADLEEVRDTVDPKIDTATITNIRECDANGLNCTTYNKADVLSGRTITWPGRTFDAGESRRYMYNVTVSSAGDYYNIAEAVPTTGATVRDDETFPTCAGKTTPKTTPKTGILSSATYALVFATILGAFGAYAYQTRTGAQVVANVIGKTKRAAWRKANKREAFERDSIRSSKKKT